ncbi:MAG: PAS domain S-box protein [Spirochaetes bacterium]|nr:PAS domain S-box protein [Spirochaetota bacterium]
MGNSLLLSSIVLLCCAIATGAVAEALVIDDNFEFAEAGPYVQYLTDVPLHTTIDEIVTRYKNKEFTHSTALHPSFGYSQYCVWIAFTVKNKSMNTVSLLFEYDYPIIDDITLFIPDTPFKAIQTGDRYPFVTRPIPYRSFVFPVNQRPGLTTYFLRIRSEGSLVAPLKLWSPHAFEHMRNSTLPLIWMHYGLMLALFFYNMFLFATVREKSFLFVSMFIIGVTLFAMANNGIAAQYLWPSSTWWGNICHPFFVFFAMVGILLFTREFLSLHIYISRLDKFILYLAGITTLCCVLPFILPYYYVTQLSVLMAAIGSCVVIITGIIAQIKKIREAIFYNIATISFVTGVLLIGLRSFGVLGDNFFTAWGYQLGSSAMIILFSLGIADKVNTWRREKERALSRLATSETRYRTLVENAHDGIILVQNGTIIYANAAFARIMGYSIEELTGMPIESIIAPTPLGQEVIIQYNNRLHQRQAKLQYEAQLKRKTGTIVDVLISAQLVALDGIPTSIAIITDISALKEAYDTIQQQYEEIQSQYEELEAINEEMARTHYELFDTTNKLAEEKERLQATLHSIYDAVIATDLHGTIILTNERAENLTGKTFQELQGKPFNQVFSFKYMTTKEDFKDPVETILQHGKLDTSGIALSLQTSEKNIIVELSGAPIYVEGKRIGTVIVVHDITDQYFLEKEIQKISKLESLSILAGGIAHDFNNLLTSVIGNLSILKVKLGDSSDNQKYIERIENAAQRAADLTKQLLTFSKGGEPIKEVASLEQIIHDTAQFTLSGSNVRCDIAIDHDLWNCEIDVGQISQVFHNLILNAAQSMPHGGTISITAHNYIYDGSEQKPLLAGKYIKISIKDQGVGIPKENISKIFDPFFTTKATGSGLGLATSYSIIKRHGGYIEVNSEIGKGSEFIIYLHATDKQSHHKGESPLQVSSAEGRILLMDDDFTIYEVASHMLEIYGFSVDWVENGEKAIAKYRESIGKGTPYDIIIMDLTVPGAMGGAQAVQEILEINPNAKVIVSSGYSNDPIMSHYHEYGFKGVIAKPYNIAEIIKVINQVLAQ